MTILEDRRRAIAPLLDQRNPADAVNVYYALYHPPQRTTLMTTPPDGPVADGYVVLARTGIDLFRPLVTMRLPADLDAQAALLRGAIPAGASVIIQTRAANGPLLGALFDIEREERLRLYRFNPRRYEPQINVLITETTGANGLPRFVIRQPGPDGRLQPVASAGLNWESRNFAEIGVEVHPGYQRRGLGRAVVARMVEHVLADRRTPLYLVSEHNSASIRLAEGSGFRQTGSELLLLDATMRPGP